MRETATEERRIVSDTVVGRMCSAYWVDFTRLSACTDDKKAGVGAGADFQPEFVSDFNVPFAVK